MDPRHEGTELLAVLRTGDSAARERALDRLLPLVYDELREIAHRQLRRQPDGHTLSTTALVHEVYLKLVDQSRVEWQDRAHFFALAARAMRHILVDYARRHEAAKRGGDLRPVSLNEALLGDPGQGGAVGDALLVADGRADTLIALDGALTQLAEIDERLCRVVEYRFFGGLGEEEIAAELGVTTRTVRREWAKAKAWLLQAMHD